MNRIVDMSLDPNEYDLDELRGTGENGFVFPNGSQGKATPTDVLHGEFYRELLLLQGTASDADLEKPYLASLPGTFPGEVMAFEWLEFLTSKGGFKRTLEALRYYQSLDWMTESVERRCRDYLDGIDEPPPDETTDFDRSDHLLSLVYIARLAAV